MPRRTAKLVDNRQQRAELVVRRAEIAQADMRLAPKALFQLGGQARLGPVDRPIPNRRSTSRNTSNPPS